jgi:hypothetical protein
MLSRFVASPNGFSPLPVLLWTLLAAFCAAPMPSHADETKLPLVYQGRLQASGQLADANYDFQFILHDAAASEVGLATTFLWDVPVENGLFQVTLDFDERLFDGTPRWLEIGVKPAHADVEFETLTPRQPIGATPHAFHAQSAGTAARSVISQQTEPGSVNTDSILHQAIIGDKIAPGQVVRSLNQLSDHVTLLAGDNIALTPGLDGLRIDATPPPPGDVPVLTANTLWVDGEHGNDATAQRGRQDRPWLNLTNALASLADGDRLVIRPGTYPIERLGMPVISGDYQAEHSRAPLLLKGRSNITIDGHGATLDAPNLGAVLSITDCTNVTIRGLRFVGSGPNLEIPSQFSGEIVLWGTNVNLTFDQCHFVNFPNHGILVSQAEKTSFDTTVQNSTFRNGGTLNHGTLGLDGAAIASLGPGMKVIGCTFDNVLRCVEIEAGFNTQPIGPALIANNIMRNFWSAGVVIFPVQGDPTLFADITISDNLIHGDRQIRPGAVNQAGIWAGGGSRLVITGNNVGRCANTGISLTTTMAPLTEVIVANNLCWNNGDRNIAVIDTHNRGAINGTVSGNQSLRNGNFASIQVGGQNLSVTDNTIVDSSGRAIFVSAPPEGLSRDIVVSQNRIRRTQWRPIGIGSAVHGTVVRDNDYTGEFSRIDDSGTDTLKDQAFLNRQRAYAPSPLQTLIAISPIVPNAYNLRVSGFLAPVTLLSTPTILPGNDGQILSILGTSSDAPVTLQDHQTLPESGLGLGANTRTLGRGDILTLRYDATDNLWWEVHYSAKP